MKLHEILIMTMFVTVVFAGMMFFYAEGASEYGSTGMDTTTIASFNNSLYEIQDINEDVKTAMSNLQGSPSAFDIFGSVSIGAYAAIKTAGLSWNVLFNVLTDGVGVLPIGDFKNVLILFLGGSILIIFFIAIIAHFIRPSDRL